MSSIKERIAALQKSGAGDSPKGSDSTSSPGISPTAAPVAGKRWSVGGAPSPKCAICTKTVFKQEELLALGKVYHSGCFTCSCPKGDGCGRVSHLIYLPRYAHMQTCVDIKRCFCIVGFSTAHTHITLTCHPSPPLLLLSVPAPLPPLAVSPWRRLRRERLAALLQKLSLQALRPQGGQRRHGLLHDAGE